jgi:hypothetical protein
LMTGQTTPLSVTRAQWYQQDITNAGWPLMTANTYYWIVVSPSTTLTVPNGLYNGALWAGLDETVYPPERQRIPTDNDPLTFRARQLTSRCGPSDTVNTAGNVNSVGFVKDSENWPSVTCAESRYFNWAETGSRIRYGVQLIGWQTYPSGKLAYYSYLFNLCYDCVLYFAASPSPSAASTSAFTGT